MNEYSFLYEFLHPIVVLSQFINMKDPHQACWENMQKYSKEEHRFRTSLFFCKSAGKPDKGDAQQR